MVELAQCRAIPSKKHSSNHVRGLTNRGGKRGSEKTPPGERETRLRKDLPVSETARPRQGRTENRGENPRRGLLIKCWVPSNRSRGEGGGKKLRETKGGQSQEKKPVMFGKACSRHCKRKQKRAYQHEKKKISHMREKAPSKKPTERKTSLAKKVKGGSCPETQVSGGEKKGLGQHLHGMARNTAEKERGTPDHGSPLEPPRTPPLPRGGTQSGRKENRSGVRPAKGGGRKSTTGKKKSPCTHNRGENHVTASEGKRRRGRVCVVARIPKLKRLLPPKSMKRGNLTQKRGISVRSPNIAPKEERQHISTRATKRKKGKSFWGKSFNGLEDDYGSAPVGGGRSGSFSEGV